MKKNILTIITILLGLLIFISTIVAIKTGEFNVDSKDTTIPNKQVTTVIIKTPEKHSSNNTDALFVAEEMRLNANKYGAEVVTTNKETEEQHDSMPTFFRISAMVGAFILFLIILWKGNL